MLMGNLMRKRSLLPHWEVGSVQPTCSSSAHSASYSEVFSINKSVSLHIISAASLQTLVQHLKSWVLLLFWFPFTDYAFSLISINLNLLTNQMNIGLVLWSSERSSEEYSHSWEMPKSWNQDTSGLCSYFTPVVSLMADQNLISESATSFLVPGQ